MTLLDFFKNLSMGGWTSLFVVSCLLIEITPIKINPIGWLGERLNARMYKRVDNIEKKLDNHVAEGYRNSILNVQRELLKGTQFTIEEWNKAIESCQDYENYCKDNKIANGVIIQAITYIRSEHQVALQTKNIAVLPTSVIPQANSTI